MNKQIARKVADRAIQNSMDSPELRERMTGLFDNETIEYACEILDDFYGKQGDEIEDFIDNLFKKETIENLKEWNRRKEGSTACLPGDEPETMSKFLGRKLLPRY